MKAIEYKGHLYYIDGKRVTVVYGRIRGGVGETAYRTLPEYSTTWCKVMAHYIVESQKA